MYLDGRLSNRPHTIPRWRWCQASSSSLHSATSSSVSSSSPRSWWPWIYRGSQVTVQGKFYIGDTYDSPGWIQNYASHMVGPVESRGPKYLKWMRARSTTYSYWCWHGNSDGGQTPCEPWWCPLKQSAYSCVTLTDALSGGGIWKLYLLNWGTVCSRWRVGMMRQRHCRACQPPPAVADICKGPEIWIDLPAL